MKSVYPASFVILSLFFMAFAIPEPSGRWEATTVFEENIESDISLVTMLLTHTITNTLSVTCEDIGELDFSSFPTALIPTDTTFLEFGVPSDAELVLNVGTIVTEPVSETNYVVFEVQINDAMGLPSAVETSYPPGVINPESQTCIPIFGTPLETGLFHFELNCTVIISVFGSPFELSNFVFDHWIRVLPNENGIPGCVYPFAGNYSPIATFDDGSCLERGCTDPSATNYSPTAEIDSELCVYCGEVPDTDLCPEDIDADGFVTTADLLLLLGSFGGVCLN